MNPYLETYTDLKYLLNRNYKKKSALEFVSNQYGLNSKERYFFGRTVFSEDHLKIVNEKMVDLKEISNLNGIFAVDGFNVLITTESLIEGVSIECEDSVIRDLKHLGGYKLTDKTEENIKIILKILLNFNLRNFDVYFDKQTSKSGEISKITRNLMEKYSISGNVILSQKADFELKNYNYVGTSDFHVIKKVKGFLDIPKMISKNYGLEVTNFMDFIKKEEI